MALRYGIEILVPISLVLLPSNSFSDGKWREQRSFLSPKEAKINITLKYYANQQRSLKVSVVAGTGFPDPTKLEDYI